MERDLAAALARWRAAGLDVATSDDAVAGYGRSISEHRRRRIAAVIRPADAAEVPGLLAVAGDTGVPVYPISTGRNWGLGSKMPVADDCVVVDLSRLDRIRALSARHRYAIVEPGVTQRALARELAARDLPLTLNVTGAGGHTSVVGNVVERGVGILGQRQHEVRGLEVALATGAVVRTGLWHFAGDGADFAHHYPAGLGPDLTGLFLQSNLGVVTAVVLDLAPRQPTRNLLWEIPEAHLARVIDAVADLRATGVIGDRVEIDEGSDLRMAGLVTRPGSWLMWIPVRGEKRLADARDELVVRALEGLCPPPRRFTSADLADRELAEPARVRLELTDGEPTNFSVESIARMFAVVVDDAAEFDLDDHLQLPGFLCVLPIVPLEGGAVREVIATVREVTRAVPVMAGMSFNTVSDTAMESYVRVLFQRTSAESVGDAHRWCAELHRALRAARIWPMRLDVDQMASYTGGDDPFWRTVADLKRALDPRGVIAPGRYAPVTGSREPDPR